MCEPAGEIPPDPDFARGVSLKLEGNNSKVRHRQIARSLQPAARPVSAHFGPSLQGVNAFKSYFLYCTIIQVKT